VQGGRRCSRCARYGNAWHVRQLYVSIVLIHGVHIAATGRCVFSLAIVGFGVETLVCARTASNPLGPGYAAVPVIPWLPAIPWLAFLFGAILVLCGVGLLFSRAAPAAANVIAVYFVLGALIIVLPKYVGSLGNMSLRTVVFEPLTIASLAWLLPDRRDKPGPLAVAARGLLALSLIVFGVDHFLALAPIGSLIPAWIPWHVMWVGFFGIALIAAGLGIGLNILRSWAAAGLGTIFAIWVVTLHLPRVLGLYAIPGAPTNPDEWSSLLIAAALWGGGWSLARQRVIRATT
jgi:uncharacterized membrane protein